MMKFSVSLVAVLIVSSCINICCSKFIDVPIDNRVGINELDDFEQSIILLEPGSDHHFTDLMTDDYTYKLSAGHVVRDAEERLRPIYTFAITKESISRDQMLGSGMNPSTALQRYYFRINNTSMIIARAEELIKGGKLSDKDLKRINNVIAHCKAIRAYCHFMLVNLFGKQYDSATADTDFVLPYIGEYNGEAIVHRPKHSVKYFYDNIEAELLSALDNIDENNVAFNSKFYFNKTSIHAFLCRLYLNKKDFVNSIKYADLVLNENNVLLNVRGIKSAANNNSDLYSKNYFDPNNVSFLHMGNNTYQLIAYFWHGFYIDPLTAEMGTRSEAIQTSPLVVDIIPIKLIYFYSLANRNMNLPLFTVDEVLYNKLESTILKDNAVSTDVKASLKRLIDNHLTSGVLSANRNIVNEVDALSDTQGALDLLLRVKRFRFHAEGMRWFDIKRHNLSVSHDYLGQEFKIDGTNPQDYVIQLPLEEINFNEDINSNYEPKD